MTEQARAYIQNGVVTNVIIADDDYTPPDGVTLIVPTTETGPAGGGYMWENGVFTAPPLPPEPYTPIRVSKIEFRRLLKPQEAAVFRLLEAAPKITAAELTTVFTTGDVELQIRVAVEDAIQQFNLLPEFIELNHPDTAEFLGIMSLAGMFADDSAVRIPQILAGNPPE